MNMARSWRWATVRFAIAAVLGTGLVASPTMTAQAFSAGSGGVTPQSYTYYRVVARHSGKCLDVAGNSHSNGDNLQQYTCNGGPNQQWRLLFYLSSGGGWYEIIVASTGKCLDIEGASRADRAMAQQYTCHGGDNQLFQLVFADSGGYYAFVARHSGKCLDVEGDLLTDHAKVWQYTCDYDRNQLWGFF